MGIKKPFAVGETFTCGCAEETGAGKPHGSLMLPSTPASTSNAPWEVNKSFIQNILLFRVGRGSINPFAPPGGRLLVVGWFGR